DHAEMEGSGARDRKPDRWQRRSVEHDGGRHGSDVRCEGGSGGRAGHGDWIPAISVEEGHDWNDAAVWRDAAARGLRGVCQRERRSREAKRDLQGADADAGAAAGGGGALAVVSGQWSVFAARFLGIRLGTVVTLTWV